MASQVYADYTSFTTPPVSHVPASKWGGRVKRYSFSHVLTSALAVGETLTGVAVLPPKARVAGGKISHSGLGASTAVDVGIAGAGTKYANAKALGATASVIDIAMLPAENFQSETTAAEVIVLTARGASWGAGQTIAGYIDVVIGD